FRHTVGVTPILFLGSGATVQGGPFGQSPFILMSPIAQSAERNQDNNRFDRAAESREPGRRKGFGGGSHGLRSVSDLGIAEIFRSFAAGMFTHGIPASALFAAS